MSRLHWARAAKLAVAIYCCFSAHIVVAQPPVEDEGVVASDELPTTESDVTPPEFIEQAPPRSPQAQTPVNPFRNPPSRQNRQPNRTNTSQVSRSRANQSVPRNFNIRLARAPKMLGDFFGRGGTTSQAPIFVGRAAHHTTGSNANNDLHLLDESGSIAYYDGGSNGGLKLMPPDPSPPLPITIEGISHSSQEFIAMKANGTVDVYEVDNPNVPDLAAAEIYDIYKLEQIALPNPSAGDLIGRVRLQDNNSPIPQDRVFFDYSFFHNVPFIAGGGDVSRFSPGLEKTFWNGMASFEVRVPMGVTLNSNIAADLPSDVSHTEFGNMALASKFLLTTSEECALAAGLGVSLPTADSLDVGLSDGTKLISISNHSAHILPYIAYLYTPRGGNCFMQAFLTFDFDTKGNPVYADANGNGLEHIGVWQDQHLANLSLSAGSWLYENYSRNSCLKRIAWSAEMHYTATLNDADTVNVNNFIVGDHYADLSLLNGTFGGHVTLHRTTFTAGYSVPLTSNDRVFDGELRFFVNRAF